MNRSRSLRPLTANQTEIMNVIWDRGEATVSEIWKALSEQREIARNTVLTQVQRLEERGWLARERRGRTDVYRSRAAREASERQKLRDVLDEVFDGSAENLVVSLLGHDLVSRDELDRIRTRLEEADESAPKRPRKKKGKKR